MPAEILDGKKIAAEIYDELRTSLADLVQPPMLTVVLVGEDPASQVYTRMKVRKCEELGIRSQLVSLPATISQAELLQKIEGLNANDEVNGILVQMPLPSHIDEDAVINHILPEKDVDGFHPVNKGRLQTGQDTLLPCTPAGIIEILDRSGHSPSGKNVVVVGRSQIVGMPIALLLTQKGSRGDATVTICHSRTKNLSAFTQNADIVIAAIGRPEIITTDMLSPDAVVIDVGVNRVEDPDSDKGYRLVGDVSREAREHVRAITPVPGGVGPLTIAMLMHNTVKAARQQSM